MGKKRRSKKIRLPGEIIGINRKVCIGCTACAINCTKITNISVLKLLQPDGKVVTPKKGTFNDSGCIYCGQCTLICPTGAINAKKDYQKIEEADASEKYMIAMFAPSLKATLGEEFNNPIGTDVSGKLPTSAKLLGFDKVFETDFGADMTVVEEANELYERINNKGILPMFTSCCPAWIKWAERFRGDLIPHISSCKSPQQMMGAAVKTYYAEKNNLNPNDIFLASIKPCTAKKYESERVEMGRLGYMDVDVVLTVREYAELLKLKGININDIPNEKADPVMGEFTGAGVIFGAGGGVLRASLRTLAYYFNATNIDEIININLRELKGFPGINVSEVKINNLTLKVAAISGISNLIRFLNSEKWREYAFIEVMACPGGCINGGGTPKVMKRPNIQENFCISCGTCIENCPVRALEFNANGVAAVDKNKCVGCTLCSNLCRSNAISTDYYDKSNGTILNESYIALRKTVLENIDRESTIRISNENPALNEMYKTYFGVYGSTKAKELLHTKYNNL